MDTSKCFFHYTTREAAFGDIIPRRRLRFSTYAQIRDPMENKHWTFPAGYVTNDDEPDDVFERAYFEFHHLAAEISIKLTYWRSPSIRSTPGPMNYLGEDGPGQGCGSNTPRPTKASASCLTGRAWPSASLRTFIGS